MPDSPLVFEKKVPIATQPHSVFCVLATHPHYYLVPYLKVMYRKKANVLTLEHGKLAISLKLLLLLHRYSDVKTREGTVRLRNFASMRPGSCWFVNLFSSFCL